MERLASLEMRKAPFEASAGAQAASTHVQRTGVSQCGHGSMRNAGMSQDECAAGEVMHLHERVNEQQQDGSRVANALCVREGGGDKRS